MWQWLKSIWESEFFRQIVAAVLALLAEWVVAA